MTEDAGPGIRSRGEPVTKAAGTRLDTRAGTSVFQCVEGKRTATAFWCEVEDSSYSSTSKTPSIFQPACPYDSIAAHPDLKPYITDHRQPNHHSAKYHLVVRKRAKHIETQHNTTHNTTHASRPIAWRSVILTARSFSGKAFTRTWSTPRAERCDARQRKLLRGRGREPRSGPEGGSSIDSNGRRGQVDSIGAFGCGKMWKFGDPFWDMQKTRLEKNPNPP